ncbi:hypothetical protein [Clostridium beijerinckii]|nr:hypothetical protein [Clostridium beijerinckii]NRT72600.1 hypothetical protein [Clostridium beijerinckii]
MYVNFEVDVHVFYCEVIYSNKKSITIKQSKGNRKDYVENYEK